MYEVTAAELSSVFTSSYVIPTAKRKEKNRSLTLRLCLAKGKVHVQLKLCKSYGSKDERTIYQKVFWPTHIHVGQIFWPHKWLKFSILKTPCLEHSWGYMYMYRCTCTTSAYLLTVYTSLASSIFLLFLMYYCTGIDTIKDTHIVKGTCTCTYI